MSGWQLRCGVAAVALVVAAGGAHAQNGMNDQIQVLQQQIQQLQQQLQNLQTQVNQQAAQPAPAAAPVAAAAPAPGTPPAPHVTQSPANRFGIESADGNYSIGLQGRLDLDFGGYPGYSPDSKATSPSDLNAGVNARRARLGVVGKFAGDFNYTFMYDFGGSNDNGPGSPNSGVAATGTGGIENAYITYNGLNSGPVPLAFDLGYMDTPFTLDEATSSKDILFMERSSSQVVATELNTGDFRSAAGVRSSTPLYWAGIYGTGPVSGATHGIGTDSEPWGMFGRFALEPVNTPDYSFHIGVDADALLHPANVPTGLTTLTLSDRPELRIDTTSLLTTTLGPTATAATAGQVTGGEVYGIETAGGWQNWFLQGEGFNYEINRRGMPDNNFWGGYLEGSWTVTGEHRTYLPATGAYSGIIPAHPFSIKNGDWGAWELAARISYIDLNDNFNGTANGTSTTSNSAEGGRQTALGFGVNWYLNPNMRFMLDYLHVVVKKTSTAGAQAGATIDEIGGRAQVNF